MIINERNKEVLDTTFKLVKLIKRVKKVIIKEKIIQQQNLFRL